MACQLTAKIWQAKERMELRKGSDSRRWRYLSAFELAAFLAVIGLLLAAPVLPTARAATLQVSIVDLAFQPANLELDVGDTVTWTNDGSFSHTATADDSSWSSGTLVPGGTYSRTFDTAGVYSYHCALHPSMTGTLYVGIAIPEFSSSTLVALGMASLMIVAIVLVRRRGQ